MNPLFILGFLFGVAFSSQPEENIDAEDGDLSEGDLKFMPGQVTRGSVTTRLWPNGVFVYAINSSLKDQPTAMARIKQAMNAWTSKTSNCIKFKERTTEPAYVLFFKGSGCWSYVGKTGRMQQLSLASGCWRHGTIVHEIGHALGFLHEQSRPDRDSYVTILFENIRSGKEGNFRKSASVNSLGTPYDFGSIMHYGEKYFSKNGQPTIVPKKAGVTIGQRNGLSPIDVQQMMLLYKCSGGGTKPPTATPSGTFSCNFDKDLCGFTQIKDDVFDWTRNYGGTPSSPTGPSEDHTSGKGFYMYIEASRPRKPGENAVLLRKVNLPRKSCLKFYYHMYGFHMGTLRVKLCNRTVFEKNGDKGNKWLMANVPLPDFGTNKELTFEGVVGTEYSGDAAIDDILIYDC